METRTQASDKTLPSVFERVPPPEIQAKTAVAWRKLGFSSALLAVPAVYGIGRMLRSRRTGAIAGGLALLGLGALRWQLARWFTVTPAYESLGREGVLELRRYPVRIEARTETAAITIDDALLAGYGRLECFLYGANSERETIDCVTPVLTWMHGGVYTTAFVMPPHRSAASLPNPDDLRVELREIPEKTIAAYRFTGPFTRDHVAHEERRFLRALVDAGLVAKGSIMLATYDAPTTLPRLRKTELWIEVV